MILPADTSIKELSTFSLNLLIEEATAELKARKVEKVKTEMTKLYKAIENYQKNGFKFTTLVDVDGNEMLVSEIAEIYDDAYDCGFAFGPWTDEN